MPFGPEDGRRDVGGLKDVGLEGEAFAEFNAVDDPAWWDVSGARSSPRGRTYH